MYLPLCFNLGAFLIFNPTYSPDLNPIEKMFDIFLSRLNRRALELSLGLHGARRPLGEGDFTDCIEEVRATRNLYKCVFLS